MVNQTYKCKKRVLRLRPMLHNLKWHRAMSERRENEKNELFSNDELILEK